MALLKAKSDCSDAVRTTRDSRRKGNQEANSPILPSQQTGRCKHNTALRTCHTRKSLFACGSSLHCHVAKQSSPHARFMSYAWLDRITFLLPHSTPSLHYLSNRSNSCVPQRRVPFGRMAEQSPLTGCEPSDLVEVSSTEVTTMLSPLRKASIGSTYNSGEDVATTPASSEVEKRPTWESWLHCC